MKFKQVVVLVIIPIILVVGGIAAYRIYLSQNQPASVAEEMPGDGVKIIPVLNPGEMSAAEMQDEKREEKSDKTKKKRKILYWRAPMDPTEIYDHPGKSRMGMDLIPVYEGEEQVGAGGTISIDPVTVQNMGIRTEKVKRMRFTRLIRTVGKIDYNEENLFTISPKISGWVEKLYVNYTGKMVHKGEPLLEIYSPDLVTTQEEYLLAYNNKKLVGNSRFDAIRNGAETLLQSSRKRLLYWDIQPSEIEELEKTGKVRKAIRLYSPTNGVVLHKNAVEGVFVKEGTNLYQIADLSTIWVYASIYDYELPWIQVGQEAKVELSYLPGKTFTGKVIYVYPYLNEKARDIKIRMEFPNPNLELKPGMYANVILEGKPIPDALVVPSEAVIRTGERNIVFVARGNGKFEPRKIQIGEEGGPNNKYLRVLSGLLEGESVVTSAQFLLDSESRLQEAIQKMLLEKQQSKATPGSESKDKENQKMDEMDMKNMQQKESKGSDMKM